MSRDGERKAWGRRVDDPAILDSDPVRAAEAVKRQALALGADFVGIGNIERWEGAPLQMDPKQIMPECRSIICLGFRVMRGSLRGVEEGTYFANYSAMGYGGVTHLYMPVVIMNMAKYIEDHGYEAVPYAQVDEWRGITNLGWMKPNFSRPVAPGKPAPDVMLHSRIAAFLCGCGEIGMSKMFLSPLYGPRCRVGLVMTEAELAPDALYDGPKLCNGCGACVQACPGQAFDKSKTVKLRLAGRDVEWWDFDGMNCDVHFRGGVWTSDDLPEDEVYDTPNYGKNIRRGSHTPFVKKPQNLYNTGQAVCGARGCTRACMTSLESRGVLQNEFKAKFRRRTPWSVDWSEPPLPVEEPATQWRQEPDDSENRG